MHRIANPRPPSLAEKAFVVFVLLLSTGAFLNLGGPQNSANPDGGMFGMQVLWSLIYLATFVLLYKSSNGLIARLKKEFWLILLVVFALASALWSADPQLTVRRGIALVCTTFFGVYLADRYSLKQQLRLLSVTFGIAAVFSVVFQLLGLGTAVDVGVPGWIGVFVQKNVLGINMAFAAAVLLIVRKSDSEYRNWATAGAVLAVALLILSQSMTSVLMFVFTLAMFPVSRWLRKSYRTFAVGTLIVLPLSAYGAVWSFDHLDAVTGVLGKDPSMTGRVPLWILSTAMALRRPWLGYGYDAFWHGLDGPSAPIWRVLTWGPPHSHNGLLEVWLGLGFVGVVLCVIGFVVYAKRAVQLLRAVPDVEGRWPLMFLTLMILSNSTGANILARNTSFWILYVAAGVTTATLPTNGVVQSRRINLEPQLRSQQK